MKALNKISTPVLLAYLTTIELTVKHYNSLGKQADEAIKIGDIDSTKGRHLTERCIDALQELEPLTMNIEKEISKRLRNNFGIKSTPTAFAKDLEKFYSLLDETEKTKKAKEDAAGEVKDGLESGKLEVVKDKSPAPALDLDDAGSEKSVGKG